MGKGGAVRWTPEQLAEFNARCRQRPGDDPPPPYDYLQGARHSIEATKAELAKSVKLPIPAQAGMSGPGEAFYALGRLAKGTMNKTEAAYAQLLDARKAAGDILDWRFHPIRVRLADNTFYEPDFLVMTAGRELQLHETKGGFTTDKGQLKIKLCAEVLPWFRVFKCTKGKDGQWTIREYSK
jgi:hypothetical protein